MMFNHRYFNFCSFILLAIFLSSTTATFCSFSTSADDKEAPCFLEASTLNPARIRSSSNGLILPCHVARSKRSTVEWWYQDFEKMVNIKIYPVYPAVRPTVLRFITSNPSSSVNGNETDIMDVSILLRQVNVDDSGIYRCVVRPWSPNPITNYDENFLENNPSLPTLSYHVELSGPRLCQTTFDTSPCFQDTRTSSPTVMHAYQTAFLQCVVQNKNASVFWVVGNATRNSAVIIDHLTTNQHNGDRLRRVFPLSLFDYSIELTVNRTTYERTYSCVIDQSGQLEATLFTYIIRSIDLEEPSSQTTKSPKSETTSTKKPETDKPIKSIEKIISHDALTPEQINELRHKNAHEHPKFKTEKTHDKTDAAADDDDDDLLEVYERENKATDKTA